MHHKYQSLHLHEDIITGLDEHWVGKEFKEELTNDWELGFQLPFAVSRVVVIQNCFSTITTIGNKLAIFLATHFLTYFTAC